MYVLGLWDGHDAGAALLEDGNIVYAANEERFTKRKLEMKFPYNSIRAALDHAQIKPTDINQCQRLKSLLSFVCQSQNKPYSKNAPILRQ